MTLAQQKEKDDSVNKKRTRTEVISDILRVIQEKNGKIKPTHLMYKANLSHKSMKLYLNQLLKNSLLKKIFIGDKMLYEITQKGRDFYIQYSKIREFEKTFGL